jgi:purine-binding chemotaxis protein CheW
MSADEEIQLVTFRIGGQTLAFSVFEVERVLRYEPPTPLPKAPTFLAGMLKHGEELIPVVDLRTRLDVPAEVNEDTRTMVLEWEQGKIGIVVDAVQELLKVPVTDVKPPPPIVKGLAAKYVNGVVARGKRTIVVLAVSRLLSSKERLQLEALAAEVVHE